MQFGPAICAGAATCATNGAGAASAPGVGPGCGASAIRKTRAPEIRTGAPAAAAWERAAPPAEIPAASGPVVSPVATSGEAPAVSAPSRAIAGAAPPRPTASRTRPTNVWRSGSAGDGCASGSGSTGSGAASATFEPVHSRKLPHDPQKLSAAEFWNPHLVQTITWRSLDNQPARAREAPHHGPGRV